MKNQISDSEKLKLYDLFRVGTSFQDAIKAMNWDPISDRQKFYYHKRQWTKRSKNQTATPGSFEEDLRYRILNNNRICLFLDNLDLKEKDIFIREYTKLYKELDGITEAEEQQLTTAVMCTILMARSLKAMSEDEDLYRKSMTESVPIGDVKFRDRVNPQLRKDYDTQVEMQSKLLNSLKATRKQRLENVNAGKDNMVEIIRELASQESLTSVSNRMVDLAEKADAELEKMLKEGFIHGLFEQK